MHAETTIPQEIKKLGKDAIKVYRQAINESKKKIPSLSMLTLERRGTSLFYQLVGKEYLKELDCTQAIDNNEVDTDTRNVDCNRQHADEHCFVLLGECDRLMKELDMVEKISKHSTVTPDQAAIDYIILCPSVSEILSKSVKSTEPFVKEPSLILNFDGQRSVHHCFISSRALYLVDFMIPDMLQFIRHPKQTSFNPLDDICYLIRSINSHIRLYSAEEKVFENVVLIGIHPGNPPCDQESIKEINEYLKKYLDDRCFDHIHSLPSKNSFFIPMLENSIDCITKKKCVQLTIKEMSQKIEFLDDYYPLNWQKFEDQIYNERKEQPIMKTQDVKKLAVSSGIKDEKQQDIALKFFHDAGKINCLGKLLVSS